ncbi:ABC transporter substrate-binding protein [Roseococcus sp. SDR]|uniref:ABC transporter substrate-binding protein n=1 Tax=Roseococcus sp. SDR TaxID=2835532 RepID=UPI001BCC62A5|nr:ABC transporter substrate-binding protein [Roseococcus sp. SDR]MBS7792338.1 ABC transporter substrate-binding protein [Roseococcus sp. SDR]MBV1847652.1 ABC transporter substrate-binding protein [Roseococcus sp. SDR]
MIGRRALGVWLAGWPAAAGAASLADGLGRELRLAAPPRRIVSLNGSAEAQLLMLGVRPIGTNLIHRGYRAHMRWLLGDAAAPAGVMNADWTPDAEAILALDPELVITWSADHAATLGRHVPVFVMPVLHSIADVRANLRALGALLDRDAEAEAVIAAFDARLAAYARLAPRRRTLMSVSFTGNRRYAFTADSLLTEVLGTIAETRRVAPHARLAWVEGGIETIHRADPDAILLIHWASAPQADAADAPVQDRLWRRLRAVREGRVIPVNGFEALAFQSIPTAARLLDTVAPRLYPDIFPAALDEARIMAPRGG